MTITSNHLTRHWSEPLAVLLSGSDLVREFSIFIMLFPASGRSVLYR